MQQADEPIARLGPADAETPLVLAVPHAGRLYPPMLLADSAVDRAVLEQLEDRHADRLAARAAAQGAVAIVARTARAWIDLNRAPDELDPAMGGADAGARVRSGLGLVPLRLGRRELLNRLPDTTEVQRRIAEVHAPYHRAVEAALRAARLRHGVAVLIDCHSMPPLRGARPARIVLGDRHGRSAARRVTQASAAAAARGGFQASLNAPYAGAYTLDRHGRPAREIHALQVEIDRSLYLDRMFRDVTGQADRVAALVAEIGWAAVDAAMRQTASAAE